MIGVIGVIGLIGCAMSAATGHQDDSESEARRDDDQAVDDSVVLHRSSFDVPPQWSPLVCVRAGDFPRVGES